jgi:hypothetical protein
MPAARHWLFGDPADTRDPRFSFLDVCDALGLDARGPRGAR